MFIFSECLESECVSSAIIGLFIFIFFIRLDNILSCHMVMLQCSHQMSQCPSPMGNVVTFNSILLGCIKKVYTVIIKQNHILLDKCDINVGLHKLRNFILMNIPKMARRTWIKHCHNRVYCLHQKKKVFFFFYIFFMQLQL